MKFAHVHLMRAPKWRRLIASSTFPLELELHRVDCISSHAMLENFTLLLDRLIALAGARALPVPIVKGGDLIALGMKPGPAMGKALKIIADMQIEGSIASRDDAFEILRQKHFI